jgi:uncharacterized Zn finger protein
MLRKALLTYVEETIPPWKHSDWPLPNSSDEVVHRKPNSPMVELRIYLAINEKNPQDALHWFDRLTPSGIISFEAIADAVAACVHKDFPKRTVDIWKTVAQRNFKKSEWNIDDGYAKATHYLRKIRDTLLSLGEQDEWTAYVEETREQYADETDLMRAIDNL